MENTLYADAGHFEKQKVAVTEVTATQIAYCVV